MAKFIHFNDSCDYNITEIMQELDCDEETAIEKAREWWAERTPEETIIDEDEENFVPETMDSHFPWAKSFGDKEIKEYNRMIENGTVKPEDSLVASAFSESFSNDPDYNECKLISTYFSGDEKERAAMDAFLVALNGYSLNSLCSQVVKEKSGKEKGQAYEENMKLVQKALKLDPDNENQYCSKEIAEFEHDSDTMALTLMLWRTDAGVEGLYTIAYDCCDPELEKGVSFVGKSADEICGWITEFADKYRSKEAVLKLLKNETDA